MSIQENQPIAIDTPLGEDVLLLQGFSGREAISSLFSFNLAMESENDSLDFGAIIGQRVTIRLTLAHDNHRYWNGIVSRFTQTGHDAGYTHYQMEVVPWLWLLTRNINSRIFQGRSVPQIVEIIFDRGGFTQDDYKFVFSGTDYDPLEYCVQYRESDFNFVSRLLEQYGFFYYFEHGEKRHTLVITDSSAMLDPCYGQKTARYDASWGGLSSEDVVTSWQMDQELRTGTCSVSDYNFQQPNQNLCLSESTIMEVGGNGRFEHYEYPAGGTALQRVDMKTMAGLRMQEVEAGTVVCSGTSGCRAFAPGYTFELKEFPREDMNASYLLREIQHSASARGSYGPGDDGGGFEYSNRFVCIPASIPFRAARVTPKPLIHGSQTAVVTGPEGEEICVDEFGRVKVQFYWDREGGNVQFTWDHENGNNHLPTSCWIRVSQLWAGKGWGSVWIPRIGQEVVVSFLEGDPDRPLIIGRVYNADQTMPYDLPDNQTVSTIKSRSTKGGNSENFNEIKFDDKKGGEDLTIHAENAMHNSVEGNQYIHVGGNRNITTGGVNQNGQCAGDLKELIFGHQNTTIKGQQITKIEEDYFLHVVGNAHHNHDGNLVYFLYRNFIVESGAKIFFNAMDSIQLMVGGNGIAIDEQGVRIVGSPLLQLNSAPLQAIEVRFFNPADPQLPDK